MKKLAILGIAVAALALVSCGGSQSVPKNAVIGGNEQNYVSQPTYVANSEELAAFTAINSFRQAMGLGVWQQDIRLDNSALNHMLYSIANPSTSTNPYQTSFQNDIEVTTATGTCGIVPRTCFTGATPSARAIWSGYYVLENQINALNVPTAVVGELYSTGSGANIVHDMVNTIYHRGAIMAQSTTQVGLARDTHGTITDTTPTHWWINHGRLNAGQSVASNYVGLYPLNAQTDVPLSMTPEYPNVFINQPGYSANSATYFATNTSSPVSVFTSTLVNLTAITFTVTPAGTNTNLGGTIWTMNNDPNLNTADYSSANINLSTPPTPVPTIPANEVFWVGDHPFAPNTTYNVYFYGTTYLVPYAITNPIVLNWSFTTGSN
jgi:hypothetical protein